MSAHPSRLLCSRSRSGRRSGLWDITKAETMLGNVPNAGKRMSASLARSSLRAMLRRAKERRRANDAVLRQLLRSGWVELVCSLFEKPMRINNRLSGFSPHQTIQQFHQARLVRITHGRFAIWPDPVGVLNPKVVVNLLPELGVGVDLMRHNNWRKIQVLRRTSIGVGDASARRDQVRVFQKAARARLLCARRRANWITL